MELNFDARGFLYHNGLNDIRTAYERTMDAMDALVDEAVSSRAKTIARIKSGELVDEEYDDEDHLLHPTEMELANFRVEEAESTANIARSAYVVILYHYWEKNCAEWMGKSEEYAAKKAYKYLTNDNVPFRIGELERMRKLTNFIKHDSKECRDDHPEFFQRPPKTLFGMRVIHADDLWLTIEHMDELFAMLRTSGYPNP